MEIQTSRARVLTMRKLSPGELIVLIAGVLLIVVLLFVPWYEYDPGGATGGLVDPSSGVQSPNGFYGVVALILTLVMVFQIVLDRLTSVDLPSGLRVLWSLVHVIAGITVAVMLVIKFFTPEDYAIFGSGLPGVVLGLAVGYGGCYTILRKFSLGEQIVLFAGVLLIVDLLFFPWYDIHIGGAAPVFGQSSGVQSPNGFYGIVALILTLVMIVQIVLDKLTSIDLPSLRVQWLLVHTIAGITVAVMLVIKFFTSAAYGLTGYGAPLGVVLGLAVGCGGCYTTGRTYARLTG